MSQLPRMHSDNNACYAPGPIEGAARESIRKAPEMPHLLPAVTIRTKPSYVNKCHLLHARSHKQSETALSSPFIILSLARNRHTEPTTLSDGHALTGLCSWDVCFLLSVYASARSMEAIRYVYWSTTSRQSRLRSAVCFREIQ
jgi:hypothetical protein